jgi:DNA-binding NtrC family response regulator
MLPRRVRRVLVIEDDADLREAVGRMLRGWGASVALAANVQQAGGVLSRDPPPDLVLLDVRLPDGSVVPLLDRVNELAPAPIVVAMSGLASPAETFPLGRLGVRAYLSKPFGREDLSGAIEQAFDETAPLRPVIAALVGRIPMREVQQRIRWEMVREALARAEGSRSGAARLLKVTRQAVQQILRKDISDGTP